MLSRLITCLVALCLIARPAWSESVTVSGLAFPVDELHQVDATNVKVSLLGTTEIVAHANLEDYVARRYFSDPQQVAKFSYISLRNFVQDAIQAGASVRASDGLGAMCLAAGAAKVSDVEQFLGDLANSENTRNFFRLATLELNRERCPGKIVAQVVLRAGISDTEWLKTKAIRLVLDHEDDIRGLSEERLYQAGLSRNFDEMERLVHFYGAAFGSEDPHYIELKIRLAKVSQAILGIRNNNLETLYTLVDQIRIDPWLTDILSPILVESLHTQASSAQTRGEPEAALTILSHIDVKRRTPTTHELVRNALAALKPSDRPMTADPAAAAFLRTVAVSDAGVKTAYIGFLDRLFQFLLERSHLDAISEHFEALTFLRPDPSPQNDRIRVQQVSAYLKAGMLYSAREKLRHVQTGVPLFSKIRFAIAGLYFDPMYIVIAVVSPIGAALVIFLVELIARLRRFLTRTRVDKHEAEKEKEEEEVQPAFVRSGFVRSMSPSAIEYRECLAVLSLTGDVDLKTIKAAYRNAVKEVHPDLNKNRTPEDAERFILLTKTYERIIELQEQVQVPKLPE